MFRHIFIATFKADISDEIKTRELADLRAIKEKIPGTVEVNVGLSTGWFGTAGQVVMTVDLQTKEDFDNYIAHPYHADYLVSKGAECFESYIAAQFEL